MAGDDFPRFPPGRPLEVPFDFDAWMKSIGRWPKDIIRREKIEELPTPPDWKEIYDRFSYDSEQPFNGGSESRLVVNSEKGPNSYFGAVALLIYGDAKWWFWVRIQHLQYFEQVVSGELISHPRYDLYRRSNSERGGSNDITLSERLGYADCWVDHYLIQQVTADLYDLYLTVVNYHSGTNNPFVTGMFDGVSKRGNPSSPHRFLMYKDNRHYQPYVQPWGDRSPHVAYTDNRKPYREVKLPMPNVGTTPFKSLVLKDVDNYLSKILWVDFETRDNSEPIVHTLEVLRHLTSRPAETQEDGLKTGDAATSEIRRPFDTPIGGYVENSSLGEAGCSGRHGVNARSEMQSSNSIRDIENPAPELQALVTVGPPAPNYARMPIANLETIVADRKIELPAKVRNESDNMKRKKLIAPCIEADDLEKQNQGRSVCEILDFADGPRRITSITNTTRTAGREERAGNVLRQITTTTTIKVITSVPKDCFGTEQSNISEGPINYQGLAEKTLTSLLLAAELHVTGDRETDTEAYRKWRKAKYRQNQSTVAAKDQVVEDEGTSEGGNRGFTAVNTLKRSRPESETESEPETEKEEEDEEEEGEEEAEAVEEQAKEEEEVEESLISSPEPESPGSVDYNTMSAAALRRAALKRYPPIQLLSREKAAVAKKALAPQLKALDLEATAERNEIRANKRARAKQRRDEAERGDQSGNKRLPGKMMKSGM